MTEKIVCAAILIPKYSGGHKDDLIVCGLRHSDCIKTFVMFEGVPIPNSSIQGFITTRNRFVDRAEAWIIAENGNQIINNLHNKGSLMSENLY